jgi:hypothetical protein
MDTAPAFAPYCVYQTDGHSGISEQHGVHEVELAQGQLTTTTLSALFRSSNAHTR